MKAVFMNSIPNSLYARLISNLISAIYLLNEKSACFLSLKPKDNTAYESLIEPYFIKEHIAGILKTTSERLNSDACALLCWCATYGLLHCNTEVSKILKERASNVKLFIKYY
jgi:hypothetical protein